MLDEQTAAEIAADWIGDVCAIPADRRFAYPQAMKTAELPDVAAAVVESRIQRSADAEDFPLVAVEQAWLNLFVVEFSIMVEQGDDEVAAAAAQSTVYGYAKTIRESIVASDRQLDGRLTGASFASPIVTFDFRQPFVEYEDGTTGRVTQGTLRIAEGIPEPD